MRLNFLKCLNLNLLHLVFLLFIQIMKTQTNNSGASTSWFAFLFLKGKHGYILNVFSYNFNDLLFKVSLNNIYPLDSFKCCTVAVGYLGLLDLLHWALTIFCIKFKLFNFTTRDLSSCTPAYESYATPAYSTASSLCHHQVHLCSLYWLASLLPTCSYILLSMSRITSHCCVISFPF